MVGTLRKANAPGNGSSSWRRSVQPTGLRRRAAAQPHRGDRPRKGRDLQPLRFEGTARFEAYDFAMSCVTEHLARSQDGATDAPDRLTRMIKASAKTARKPAIEGGCPIMNTAVEADDTHPELRDRAQQSMTLWHRLVGRIVKDGKAEGTLRADVDPYALASTVTAALEGAPDGRPPVRRPRAHGPRRSTTLLRTWRRCARPPSKETPMTTIEASEGTRSAQSSGTTPAALVFISAAATASSASPRSSVARSVRRPRLPHWHVVRRTGSVPHRVLDRGRRGARKPDGHDARWRQRITHRHRDGLPSRQRSPATPALTTLELSTNYVRPITTATGRACAPKEESCTPAGALQRPTRVSTTTPAFSTRMPRQHA